jgi:4,5-DOPA dioxygenase extradiol
MTRMPSLFVSHGSPETAIRDTPASRFLQGFAATLPRPRVILVASAHWETAHPVVATAGKPSTVYDFGGFDPRLRQIKYSAPGAPDVSMHAGELLAGAGFDVTADPGHGWDHGVWVPLHLMYPAQDIPIAQVSIQPQQNPAHHYRIGQALKPLRDEGVLIIASGALTHNLGAFRGQPVDAPAPPWVSEFADWFETKLTTDRRRDTLDYRTKAPHAVQNHPEDEHLLPLYVALGATDEAEPIVRAHASYEHAVLAMDVYKFG